MWKKVVCTYIALVVIFTSLIVAVFAIPNSAVRDNVIVSADQIDTEGIFFRVAGCPLWQIDNMTDCMMLNMNVDAETASPLHAAMVNEYGKNFSGNRGYFDMAKDTRLLAEKGRGAVAEQFCYARYWHGYQVLLRPLLTVFTYYQIRIINYILLFSLAFVVLFLLWVRYSPQTSILFGIALLLFGFPVVPLAIQFSTCFYIAFVAMIYVIKRRPTDKELPIFFFVVGAVTSYADFLTTPQITLGLPMVVVFKEFKEFKEFRKVILLMIFWFAGYSLLWATKWVLADIFTDADIWSSVAGNIALRTSSTVITGGVETSIWTLLSDKVLLILAACVVVAVPCMYVYRKRSYIKDYGALLAVALIVPLWFVLLKNHSIQHIFFTWRAWIVTFYAFSLFVLLTLKLKRQ